MKRTFIALPISLDSQYDALQSELRRRTVYDNIVWQAGNLSHLTLRFIGKTPEDKIPRIITTLDTIAQQTPALDLRINKLGVFGSHYAPQVLWLGIEPTPELKLLVSQIETEVRALGFEPSQGNFVPHITLGRIKKIDNKNRFWKMFEELQPSFHQEFHISELHFIRSRLETSGPIYSSLHISQLQ
ncbi:MAG: RNA 2',3'-cyclic phosphodiesterase [Bacteroidales bacterium]|nr:RNA 2',3'-cyclic phosphodiesterase [Bacteroidales bacterium]